MAHGEDLCEELAIAKGSNGEILENLEMAHGEDLCEELAIAKGSWLELLASILNRSCSAGGKDCQNQHVAKSHSMASTSRRS